MENNNFKPIFDYIDEQTTLLRTELASKADIQKVLNAVSSIAKNSKDNEEKTNVLETKAERIEKWVMKAAEKTEIPYKPWTSKKGE